MTDKIREAFLRRQFEEGMELVGNSDVLDLTPLTDGDKPCRYIAHFEGLRGLVRNDQGQIVMHDKFMVGIWFPEDYLRRVDIPQVLTYLGPHPDPWHPNIRPPFVCAHITPGTGLVDILYTCYEIWTWNLYATGDEGLNHAASQWSRKQERSRFPIDRRPLKRRTVQTNVTEAPGRKTA
jgi:hypothetical protein